MKGVAHKGIGRSRASQHSGRTIGYYTIAAVWGGGEKYLRDLLLAEGRGPCRRSRLFCRHSFLVAAGGEVERAVDVVGLDAWGGVGRGKGPVRAEKRSAPLKAWRLIAPNSLKLLAGTGVEVRRMAAFFRAHPVDLLHFNDAGFQPVLLAAKLAGTPRVIETLHRLPSEESDKTDLAHRTIEYLSVRCVDAAIAANEYVKRAWVERAKIDPRRIRVIPYGMDVDAFRPSRAAKEMKSELALPQEARVVGVTARLAPMKGHRYLLQAMPNILSAVPGAHLVLTGTGELTAALEQQAHVLRIADQVHFLGHRTDIAEVTQVYDVAVLPSVATETSGYVNLEAMALCKPVVASRFSGIPEVVADGVTGTLVAPKDPNALAEAIIDLLKDPAKARTFGEAGRRRVEEKFTLQRMLDETFALYEELLTKKR